MPTLLCSSVFLNCAIHSLNIVKVGAGKTVNGGVAAGLENRTTNSSMEDIYTLDIAGPLLPAAVVRLLTLFRHTQRASFQASFAPSDFPCTHLNCINTDSVIQLDGLRNQTVLGLCGQENLATHSQVHMAGKQSLRSIGALKRVKCTPEHFLVELHTQTY